MSVSLLKLHEREQDLPFETYKTYMKPFIEGAFGWDEAFQRKGFSANLQPEWFSWVMYSNKKAGIVCSRVKAEGLYVDLLVTFSEFQSMGVASRVMQLLKTQAMQDQMPLSLRCLRNNTPAVNLYQKLGMEKTCDDEHFFRFESKSDFSLEHD